jgi:hypothetical protein
VEPRAISKANFAAGVAGMSRRALPVLVLGGLLAAVAGLTGAADSKNMSVSVNAQEELLLTQSGANATLKVRLASGVTVQVWGDSSAACSTPTGSLSKNTSGAFSIPLNTIPFGTNQNNYLCVQSSDNKLSANVVWPHTPASVQLIQQPSNTVAGATTPAVIVGVYDTTGTLISSSTAPVTLAIGANPGNGTLSGTKSKSAVNGVANFNDLSIDKAGTGYTLITTSPGLTGATSNSFNVDSLLLTANPNSTSVSQGNTANFSPGIGTNLGGLSGTVNLSCVSIAPTQGQTLTCPNNVTFGSPSISGSQTSTVRVTTNGNTGRRTYTITINGTLGTVTSTTTITVIVN